MNIMTLAVSVILSLSITLSHPFGYAQTPQAQTSQVQAAKVAKSSKPAKASVPKDPYTVFLDNQYEEWLRFISAKPDAAKMAEFKKKQVGERRAFGAEQRNKKLREKIKLSQ